MLELRKWTTPLLSGLFLLSAVTGILMFFHAASSLARLSHEWLSWALVLAAGAHLVLNRKALAVALRPMAGKVALAGLALVTAVAAAWPSSAGGELSPGELRGASAAVVKAPLAKVAALVDTDAASLRRTLENQGLQVPAGEVTLEAVVRANPGQTRAVLETVFPRPRAD